MFYLIDQVLLRPYMLREVGASLFLIIGILVHFHFCYFLIIFITLAVVIPFLIHMLSCVDIIMLLQWSWFIIANFYRLSRVT